MAMVIASDSDRETMSLKCAVVITILLISAMSMAGCTSSTVATPTPAPAAATVSPTPAGMAAPAVTYAAFITETPATGHPYSKTFSFSGSGDYQDFTFTTDSDATWNFQMNPGQGYFLVSLKDAQNNEIAVLPTSGTESLFLKAGDYHFDIAADSPWHITMTTP
jgi:hypothetical protein